MMDMKQSQRPEGSDTLGLEAKGPEYPYGLRLDLDFEAMKKLGLDQPLPTVGQTMEIKASVKIIAVRAVDGEENNTSAELQITDMEIVTEKEPIDSKVMYPNSMMA